MKKYIILSLLLTKLCCCDLLASGGGGLIPCDSYTLKYHKEKIELEVSHSKDKSIVIDLTVEGKKIKIHPDFLFKAKDVKGGSIRLIPVGVHKKDPNSKVYQITGFIISFEFGKYFEHGVPQERDVEVGQLLRLHISKKNGLTHSELAVPMGEYKNEWSFYSREKIGQKAVFYGREKGIYCHTWYASVRNTWGMEDVR